ncbi:hypothetical protein QAD02_019338, partial [Eretmocerus hayati]
VLAFVILQLIVSAFTRSIDEPSESSDDVSVDTKRAFSLEDILSNAYGGDSFNGSWISETEIFYRVDNLLLKFDVTTQNSEIITRDSLFDDPHLKIRLSPNQKYILIQNSTYSVYRHSTLSIYSIYCLKDRSNTPLAGGKLLSTAFWAPKKSALVYVLDNDIYYHQLNDESGETRRLTFDGKLHTIFNGISDWVYEEEVLATDAAAWFSPSGEHLVFATFNDSEVREAILMRYGQPGDLENQYATEERIRYPKAGTKNPTVTLNLVDLTDHSSTLINLKAPVDIVGTEPILFAVTWFDEKTIVAKWTNRVQNISQVSTYNLNGMYLPLMSEEVSDGWLLYLKEAPLYHAGYALFLLPRSVGNKSVGSYGHLVRYRFLNGALDHELDLTPGTNWVQAVHGVNELKRVVYYCASPPDEPTQKQLYEVSIETQNPKPKCLSCNLRTPEGNTCKYVTPVTFSTDFSHFVLVCSGPDPATIRIYDLDGNEIYEWSRNNALRQMLSKRILPRKMNLTIESHGFPASVKLLLPDDFDPSKKYPLLVNVYGGPETQRITDGFSVGFDSYLSTNKHVIYAQIDGRGSTFRGTAMMYALYRNFGTVEVHDQLTVTRKLQEKFSWIDANRTGIWGWSYGGYSTAMILATDEDNLFKCGISVAPVTNWIYYDSIYTERYMGLPTPDDNLKHYESASVLNKVEKLRGKKFMLIHGTGDDNVHYQQSMALSKALAEADILYDQLSYADEAHALSHVQRHLYHSMDKFWSECFNYERDVLKS